MSARRKQVEPQPACVVKPGIEVLRESGFQQLRGKRVGLVTNPSGVDSRLKSTIDILFQAPEVNLVALYGPEHGVRGDMYAGDKVNDSVDPVTGLPVYSLYGKTKKSTRYGAGILVMIATRFIYFPQTSVIFLRRIFFYCFSSKYQI